MADPDARDAVRRKLIARGVADYIVREGGEGLIRRWNEFVAQVEKGYALGIDDYRNDLDIRNLIAVTGLDYAVRDADERLQGLLAEARRPVWESDVPNAFWVRGYPRNASGQLREDLVQSENI
jgi:hypothetical protein